MKSVKNHRQAVLSARSGHGFNRQFTYLMLHMQPMHRVIPHGSLLLFEHISELIEFNRNSMKLRPSRPLVLPFTGRNSDQCASAHRWREDRARMRSWSLCIDAGNEY